MHANVSDGQKANNDKLKDPYSQHFAPYLPPAAGFPVIGEIVTDPLVDLAQCHFLLWRAVDGERDEAGVAVWRFAVLVLLHLFLVQCGVGVQQGALLSHAWPVSVLGVCFLNGRPHGQLRQPVHGGQAALQLRRHDGRLSVGGCGEGGVTIRCGENEGAPSDHCFCRCQSKMKPAEKSKRGDHYIARHCQDMSDCF